MGSKDEAQHDMSVYFNGKVKIDIFAAIFKIGKSYDIIIDLTTKWNMLLIRKVGPKKRSKQSR